MPQPGQQDWASWWSVRRVAVAIVRTAVVVVVVDMLGTLGLPVVFGKGCTRSDSRLYVFTRPSCKVEESTYACRCVVESSCRATWTRSVCSGNVRRRISALGLWRWW